MGQVIKEVAMRIVSGVLSALAIVASIGLFSSGAFAADDEGKIAKVDPEGLTITLDNGNTYKLSGEFDVVSQSLVKEKHLKLQLARGRQRFNAIWFNHTEPLPESALVAYRLVADTWNGVTRVQLIVEHAAG